MNEVFTENKIKAIHPSKYNNPGVGSWQPIDMHCNYVWLIGLHCLWHLLDHFQNWQLLSIGCPLLASDTKYEIKKLKMGKQLRGLLTIWITKWYEHEYCDKNIDYWNILDTNTLHQILSCSKYCTSFNLVQNDPVNIFKNGIKSYQLRHTRHSIC